MIDYKRMQEELEDHEDEVECGWCNELWPKSECKKEKHIGYVCPYCQAAIKSHGEPLDLVESPDSVENSPAFQEFIRNVGRPVTSTVDADIYVVPLEDYDDFKNDLTTWGIIVKAPKQCSTQELYNLYLQSDKVCEIAIIDYIRSDIADIYWEWDRSDQEYSIEKVVLQIDEPDEYAFKIVPGALTDGDVSQGQKVSNDMMANELGVSAAELLKIPAEIFQSFKPTLKDIVIKHAEEITDPYSPDEYYIDESFFESFDEKDSEDDSVKTLKSVGEYEPDPEEIQNYWDETLPWPEIKDVDKDKEED